MVDHGKIKTVKKNELRRLLHMLENKRLHTCLKCNGKGSIKAFSYVEGGKCFECKGTGEVYYSESKIKINEAQMNRRDELIKACNERDYFRNDSKLTMHIEQLKRTSESDEDIFAGIKNELINNIKVDIKRLKANAKLFKPSEVPELAKAIAENKDLLKKHSIL